MTPNNVIRSANLHVTAKCNYRCGPCFDKNLDRGIMTPEQWKPRLTLLKERGITKINIVGGEPILYPHFIELCGLIKSMGLTVSIVSNGSLIDENMIKRMKGLVDWIGLSVDSPDNRVEKIVGRQAGGLDHIKNVIKVADMAHKNDIRVKLNITVIRQSYRQDFSDLICRMGPERVKALRVLKIEGENEEDYGTYAISRKQWKHFVKNHENIVLKNKEKIVFESGSDMIDSYLMLDPLGRVIRDSDNKRSLNDISVIEIGGPEAVVNAEKYARRRGAYDWGPSQ